MEKLLVSQVLECNKTLYKIMQQKVNLPISVGLKFYRIMKIFDEIEEYVFETMDMTFENLDWNNMTNEQMLFYKNLISEQIEVEYTKIPQKELENTIISLGGDLGSKEKLIIKETKVSFNMYISIAQIQCKIFF